MRARFGNAAPDPDNPESEEMKWLSRGLFEALIGFIGLAEDHRFALRAAFYEFHYQPVANAFAKAVEAGADVKIVYDAESTYKVENEATIGNAGLDQMDAVDPAHGHARASGTTSSSCCWRTSKPVAVWTGSTNISRWRDLRPFECRPHRLGQGRGARPISPTGSGWRRT